MAKQSGVNPTVLGASKRAVGFSSDVALAEGLSLSGPDL
jgi:hypothetical protein